MTDKKVKEGREVNARADFACAILAREFPRCGTGRLAYEVLARAIQDAFVPQSGGNWSDEAHRWLREDMRIVAEHGVEPEYVWKIIKKCGLT